MKKISEKDGNFYALPSSVQQAAKSSTQKVINGRELY